MADAPALGAGAARAACRFDPDLAHQRVPAIERSSIFVGITEVLSISARDQLPATERAVKEVAVATVGAVEVDGAHEMVAAITASRPHVARSIAGGCQPLPSRMPSILAGSGAKSRHVTSKPCPLAVGSQLLIWAGSAGWMVCR